MFGAKESLTSWRLPSVPLVTPFCVELFGIRGALGVLGLVAPTLVALAWQRLRAIDASIVHLDEQFEVLNKVDIFRPLPMPAIDNLALHLDHAHLTAGQEVFHQGDHGDRFDVIEDGEADVIGDGRLIRTMRPGDGFGEIALLHVVRARRTRWCSTGSAPSIRAAGRATDRRFAVEANLPVTTSDGRLGTLYIFDVVRRGEIPVGTVAPKRPKSQEPDGSAKRFRLGC